MSEPVKSMQLDLSPIEFDSEKPISVPIKLGKTNYLLFQVSGDAEAKQRAIILSDIKLKRVGKGRKATIEEDYSNHTGQSESDLVLLAACLYRVEQDGNTTQMDINEIRWWSRPVLDTLIKRLKHISGMEDEDEDEDNDEDGSNKDFTEEREKKDSK